MQGRPLTTVVLAAAFLFAVLTAGFGGGGIAGTSICEWDRILPDKTESYRGCCIGDSRKIRGDEWATSLPFVFAQCRSPDFFPRVNRRLNGGMDMFVQTPSAPVWDWTVPGQFHNWGYFLFDARHGLAWCWWSRYILLPLFAFLFFVQWCRDDKLIAAAGALAVALGAPTQWWDTTIPYHLTYFFATLVFAERILGARRFIWAAFAALGLFVAATSYCFINYLPFSMLLLPVLAVLFVFVCRSTTTPGGGRRARYALMLAVAVGVAAELCYFFAVHGDVLALIRDSAYPGARVSKGGSFNVICQRALLDWVSAFSAFRWDFAKLNQCEGAEYIGLWLPVVGGLAAIVWRRRKICGNLVVLALIALVFLLWASAIWPAALARLTGLSRIPMKRATVIAGFIMLVAALRLLALNDKPGGVGTRMAAALVGLCLLARIVAFAEQPSILKWFCSSGGMMVRFQIVCILSFAVIWGLLTSRRRLFTCSLVAFSCMTGLMVHPLFAGVSPVYDKQLSRKILEIDRMRPGRWIGNRPIIVQLPMALGLDAYSGTQQYCDIAFWSHVDPKGSYRYIWNRYAHRVIVDLEGLQTPDTRRMQNTVFFSLDERRTRALGIDYIIWRGNPLCLPWLREVARVGQDGIYEVLEASAFENGAGSMP